MTADTRTPDQIERDIERDRGELARTLAELESRFTPEAVIGEVARTLRRHGGDMGHAVSQSVKQNPIALALTGAGLAWMMFGRSYEEPGAAPRTPAPAPAPDPAAVSRPASPGLAAAARPAPFPEWYEEPDLYAPARELHSAPRPGDDGPGLRERAYDRAAAVGGSVQDAGRSVSDRASRAREKLAHGTESLSAEARDRVVAARERAVEARRRSGRALRDGYSRGQQSAADFFDSQPLVVGALALAVGAAIAGALPRTRTEDELLGEHSDALLAEAERIFDEERGKAERVARAALDEAQRVADEKLPDADRTAETVADEVRDAGRRVGDAAATEADRQKLGQPER